MCQSHNNCIVETSINYMDTLIGTAKGEMAKMEKDILNNMGSRSLGGSLGWGGMSIGYSYDWKGLNSVSQIEPSQKLELYQGAMMNLVMLKVFLTFFAYYIGPMLIIFGIMFKSLFITRRLGSTMIALGVSASIVLPLTIISILVANGEIKVPGAEYMQNSNCPEECTKTISAYNLTSSIESTYLIDAVMKSSPSSAVLDDLTGVLNGTNKTMTVTGLGAVSSCEWYNLDTNTANLYSVYYSNPTLKDRMDNDSYSVTYDCPSICRSIPYPADVADCRDAERSCLAMYRAAPLCFKKNYDYKNLYYTFVYNDTKMNLSNVLSKSDCFRITPLNITYKATPLKFCPTKCRLFYSDGSVPCENPGYPPDDCRELYASAAGVSNFIYVEAKIVSIYNFTNNTLSQDVITPINLTKLETEAKRISFPIYEVDNPGCLNIMKLPESMRYAPNYIDCNSCDQQADKKAGAKTAEGKFLAYSLILGIFSIAITLAAAVALSMGIEGEMFIPGINRVK
jgi:hypothetical protein